MSVDLQTEARAGAAPGLLSRRGAVAHIGSRGVLFSAMVLLLVLALLSLEHARLNSREWSQGSQNMLNAFAGAEGRFADLKSAIISLPQSAAAKQARAAALPFSYSFDSNALRVSSGLPVGDANATAYLESLNYLRIFGEQAGPQQTGSQGIDINTPLPPSWGGTDRNLHFITRPQCLRYSILDDNSTVLDFACGGLDFNSVKRLDLNLTFSQNYGFTKTTCSFNGNSSCPDDNYNPSSGLPYLNLVFLDSACPDCELKKNPIRVHFNPAQNNSVELSCNGQNCDSPPLTLTFTSKATLRFSGQRAGLSFGIDMNSAIDSFAFSDANLSVRDDYFGIRVWN